MAIQAREDFNNEPLVLDDTAEVAGDITIEASQGDLEPGTVLGEITADPGVYQVCDGAATDGSQLPKLILAEAVADDVGQQSGKSAYRRGMFDENQLVFGGASDLDTRIVLSTDDALDVTMRDALRMFGLRTAPGISVTQAENS